MLKRKFYAFSVIKIILVAVMAVVIDGAIDDVPALSKINNRIKAYS